LLIVECLNKNIDKNKNIIVCFHPLVCHYTKYWFDWILPTPYWFETIKFLRDTSIWSMHSGKKSPISWNEWFYGLLLGLSSRFWSSIRVYIIFVVWIKIQTFTSNNCIFNCCRKLCLWNQQIIKMAKSTCSALPMVCIHHAWTLSLWTMPIALNFDDFSCRPAAGWVPAISWGFPSRVP